VCGLVARMGVRSASTTTSSTKSARIPVAVKDAKQTIEFSQCLDRRLVRGHDGGVMESIGSISIRLDDMEHELASAARAQHAPHQHTQQQGEGSDDEIQHSTGTAQPGTSPH
jgi:hypothetical protein